MNRLAFAAFENCTGLECIHIPEGVKALGNYLFNGCTSLRTVDIPGSVTEILDNTFEDCDSLEEITIPAAVTGIGAEAFLNCSGLETVRILGKSVKISASAFHGAGAEIIVDGLTLGKLPKDARENTLKAFARRVADGEDIPDGHRVQCMKYIRRAGEKLLPLAETEPALMELLEKEGLLKENP